MTQPKLQASQAMIPVFAATDSIDDIGAALDEYGCAVVTGAVAQDVRERIRDELAPIMAESPAQQDDPAAFYPGLTRRVPAVVVRSHTARQLVLNPISLALTERHLGANCQGFQLHATAAVEIGPGARTQVLHREEDGFRIFPLPRPNLVLASIWAISDFTEDNGGTRVVPGSHRWTADRSPRQNEIVSAEMPAGSVFYWTGGLLHGGGENRTQDLRYGIILTYSCGWMRPEENHYLEVPRSEVASLDPVLRKLLGYSMFGGLGYRDPRL